MTLLRENKFSETLIESKMKKNNHKMVMFLAI